MYFERFGPQEVGKIGFRTLLELHPVPLAQLRKQLQSDHAPEYRLHNEESCFVDPTHGNVNLMVRKMHDRGHVGKVAVRWLPSAAKGYKLTELGFRFSKSGRKKGQPLTGIRGAGDFLNDEMMTKIVKAYRLNLKKVQLSREDLDNVEKNKQAMIALDKAFKGTLLHYFKLNNPDPVEFCIDYARAGFSKKIIFDKLKHHKALDFDLERNPTADQIRAMGEEDVFTYYRLVYKFLSKKISA